MRVAKVDNNHITEGLSGKLGKHLVVRHMRDGRTIFAIRMAVSESVSGSRIRTSSPPYRPSRPVWHLLAQINIESRAGIAAQKA